MNMRKKMDFNEIAERVEQHQRWLLLNEKERMAHLELRADFSDCDLTGAGHDLAYRLIDELKTSYPIDLTGAIFTNADLSGLDLSKMRFSKCDFNRAILKNASVQAVDFSGARIQRADLRNANLNGCSFVWANLTGSNLQGATLHGASLEDASIPCANLSEVEAYGIDLSNIDFDEYTNFSLIDLSEYLYNSATFTRTSDEISMEEVAEEIGYEWFDPYEDNSRAEMLTMDGDQFDNYLSRCTIWETTLNDEEREQAVLKYADVLELDPDALDPEERKEI